MPFVNWRGENYVCGTPSSNNSMRTMLDKKHKIDEGDNTDLKTDHTQYANVKEIMDNASVKHVMIIQQEPKPSFPYVNLEFAKSLEYYENSKELMQKTQDNNRINETQNISVINKRVSCTKCGHSQSTPERKLGLRNDDYLLMEPTANHSIRRLQGLPSSPPQSPVHDKCSQGYLPMLPISNKSEELQRLRVRQLNEKSHSIPSFPIPRRKSFNSPSAHSALVYHSISETNSPYPRRRLMTSVGTIPQKDLITPSIRRRSSSMDSSRYLDNLERIEEKVASPTKTIMNTPTISNATSIDSLSDLSLNQRPIPTSSSEQGLSRVDNSEYVMCKSSLRFLNEEPRTDNHSDENVNCDISRTNLPTIKIKRSASIPCKSVYNRDSSSSNDSGVSTGSLQFRRRDLMDLDLHSIKKISIQEHLKIVHERALPEGAVFRKSKSVDPLDDMNFLFDELKLPVKSSSAGATVPVSVTRNESKGKHYFYLL